jgi:hypothetical protein
MVLIPELQSTIWLMFQKVIRLNSAYCGKTELVWYQPNTGRKVDLSLDLLHFQGGLMIPLFTVAAGLKTPLSFLHLRHVSSSHQEVLSSPKTVQMESATYCISTPQMEGMKRCA